MKHSHRVTSLALVALLTSAVLSTSTAQAKEKPFVLKSPDGKVVVTVQPGERLSYTVSFRGKPAVESSGLGITVDDIDLGKNATSAGKAVVKTIDERYATRGVNSVGINHCKSALIPLTSAGIDWQLEVRAFNDGVAYRYVVPGEGQRRVNGESSEWRFPAGTSIWHQDEKNHEYQARYSRDVVGQMPKGTKLMIPAALKLPDNAGYGLMSEANLISYSDMAVQVADGNSFKGFFHYDPKGWDHQGEIVSPWRVTVLTADLNALVNSDMIKNLCPAPAPELENASWIRPGRSIWHWLSCYCAPKLDAQKSWVDRTRDMGYEYYLIDDGWRDWDGGGDNAWKAMKEIVSYAKGQGVDIWAWVHCKDVTKDDERKAYFKRAKETGIVGLKIDFMPGANTTWVQWYEDTLREAAAHELMVDFHGCVKPTGRERTWPNEMTREAIGGREEGKSPALHDITLPFLRFVQGHGDFTPTLFIADRLKGSSYAHELAMAVVYTSPFLCMGDNPTNYLQSAAVDVIKALPATWDETRVLPGSEIGELAAFARKTGNQWFVGAINDLTPRRQSVELSFLGGGNFKLVELADSPDRHDTFVRTERIVTRKDTLTLPLRKDGGYVAWLVPESK